MILFMGKRAIQIQGMAFVPGHARGVLRRGREAAGPGVIAMIAQGELGPFPVLPEAVIVVEAAPLSHDMIGLLTLGLPTVLVDEQQAARLEEGMRVSVDGAAGRVATTGPSTFPLPLVPSAPDAGKPVLSGDGIPVRLCASIRSVEAGRRAVTAGVAAVGLVRTEFLAREEKAPPGTEFFARAFVELCQAAMPLQVTMRLVDLAPDKMPAWMPHQEMLGGVLGLQGVRLFDRDPVRGVVEAQLRALAELGGQFDLRVLIPYLADHEDLRRWTEVVRRALPEGIPVGAMAETPSGALCLADWLHRADFLAVGCNDLMQCLFGADRDRPELRQYLDPYAPPLYRLLQRMAEDAAPRLADMQLCGVLSQLAGVLPVLLGLGYGMFSVDPVWIPWLAQTVRSTVIADAAVLAADVCACIEPSEVRKRLGVPGRRIYGAGLTDGEA